MKQFASGTAYASDTFTSEVAYAYDALGRMVSRTPRTLPANRRSITFTTGRIWPWC